MMLHRSIWICLFLAIAVSALAETKSDIVPLHQRIDSAIAASHLGSLARPATDAEFLRRSYLDLIGRSPTAEEAQSFLADESADKRRALVDQLLESDEFNDFFAVVLDLMFMERRGGSRIPQEEWKTFLRNAMARNQPFDDIVRAILGADGTGDSRGAVKFLVQREVEPNALTRDVGRIFLGRDLQCAQCHDHPNIDDYLQAEYYGILAFVNRSYLFQDPADNNKAYVGEKAEGTTEFKSVFSPEDDPSRTIPQLLGGLTLDVEPRVEGEDAYVVAPSKAAAGVPKFSRRVQLARLVTHPANRHFSRNMANRFWAHMMGRGIVDPVDFHHSDNPPSHPELLNILTEAFVAMQFDIREFVRQIALSDTYQRSIDFPEEAAITSAQLEASVNDLTAEISKLEASASSDDEERSHFVSLLKVARSKVAAVDKAITDRASQMVDLTKQQDQLQKANQETEKQQNAKQQQLDAVTTAVGAAKKAADALPKDEALAKAYAEYQQRVKKLSQEVAAMKTSIDDNQKKLEALAQQYASTSRDLAGLKSQRVGLADMVAEARGAVRVFDDRRRNQELLLQQKRQQLAAFELHRDYLSKRQSQRGLANKLAELEDKPTAGERQVRELEASLAAREKDIAAKQAEMESRLQLTTKTKQVLADKTVTLAILKQAIATAQSAANELSDPTLAESVNSLSEQYAELSEQLTASRSELEQKSGEIEAVRKDLRALIISRAKFITAREMLTSRSAQRELDIADIAAAYQAAIVEADLARGELRESWERRYAVRTLKPLSPEQLAGSVIAALELKSRFQNEAENEWANKNKDKKPEEVDREKRQAEIEALVKKRKADVENTYISLFAAPAGAPQDVFSSTADQALFLINDGRVQNWLSPSDGTLLKRLQSVAEPQQIAEELYLAILTRPADETEKQKVSEYLAERKGDRHKTIQELAWGLLSSLEFRFNH